MSSYIFIKSGNATIKIVLAEIVYLEAEGKYIRIVTTGRSHLIRGAISTIMQSLLINDRFCRVHKSYIVSLDRIIRFDRKSVLVGNKTLPVGRIYKRAFETMVADLFESAAKSKKISSKVNLLLQSINSTIIPKGSLHGLYLLLFTDLLLCRLFP